MKKLILLASVASLSVAVIPMSASATTAQPQTAIVQDEYDLIAFFYFSNVASGSTHTDSGVTTVPFTQHVEAKMTDLSSASTVNANLYLVNASTGVAVRGPVKVTNTTTTYTFYDVTPGNYKVRLVNNGASTLTKANGFLSVDR